MLKEGTLPPGTSERREAVPVQSLQRVTLRSIDSKTGKLLGEPIFGQVAMPFRQRGSLTVHPVEGDGAPTNLGSIKNVGRNNEGSLTITMDDESVYCMYFTDDVLDEQRAQSNKLTHDALIRKKS